MYKYEIVSPAATGVAAGSRRRRRPDSSLGDFIEDKNAPDPSDTTANSILRERVRAILETLTERERRVVEERFGLIEGYPRTLEEVGRKFNVTRERIRQIEAKALKKLRHPTRIRSLQGFLAGEVDD